MAPDLRAINLEFVCGEEVPVNDTTLLKGCAQCYEERVAVVDGKKTWSYATLHSRTNRLARLLHSHGVKPGVFVGIALERSAALVEAIHAVVKAGGAYVPLDPDYPAARLDLMLAKTRAKVLLTSSHLAPRLPVRSGVKVIRLDADAMMIESLSDEDFSTPAGEDDPLYAIFTSGSTGEPKGAAVRRLGFANLIEWFSAEFSFGPEDRFLLLSSPGFDLTQKNFFTPLKSGGRIVCYPPGPFDLVALLEIIEREGITVMNCTPSAFYPLIDGADDKTLARLASLRLVVLGGEAISIPRLRDWLQHPSCRAEVANTYGPTECTDICGFYRLHRDNLDDFSFVPLGRAIHNVQLAVVDEALQPVPASEAGELLIGGIGVGLGYLEDSALTEASFVPNPLPTVMKGVRAYRSGDRVKLLPQGVLEFLGRVDHQIKLRGFRIELAEIEAALTSHPSVKEATVVFHESSHELNAWYVPTAGAAPVSAAELRKFLAGHLPDYMLPRNIVALEALPLTAHGKINRQALLASSPSGVAPERAAASGSESILHRFWREVLDLPQVGLNANFFDLGGDSIQLARLHARIVAWAGRSIPITDLFAHPTIASLAAHLAGERRETAGTTISQRAFKQREALAAGRRARG